MKKCNCPECGKELIRLEPFENGVYEFWCDDCNIDIVITKNNETENKFLGTIVEWADERWYVDNTDENFKDEMEETSLFLLPEKYANADEMDNLMYFGKPDDIGYWVYESLVKPIK